MEVSTLTAVNVKPSLYLLGWYEKEIKCAFYNVTTKAIEYLPMTFLVERPI